jgi:YhcH/YjgK/YiaL family protein
METRISILFITLALSNISCSTTKVAVGNKNESEINRWFNKKDYLKDLKIEPHSTTNKKEFARQYKANKKYWDAAFAYLQQTDLDKLPKGKYSITPENLTVSVTFDSTRNLEKTNWESHRKLIDIQYIISGEEKMGVAPVSSATVTKPYDETRDVANYSVDGKYYVSERGKMFIFFPSDAHRPNITTGGNLPDKKIVIKIPVAQ